MGVRDGQLERLLAATLPRAEDCVLAIASSRTAPGKRRPPPASCIATLPAPPPNVLTWAAAASRHRRPARTKFGVMRGWQGDSLPTGYPPVTDTVPA